MVHGSQIGKAVLLNFKVWYQKDPTFRVNETNSIGQVIYAPLEKTFVPANVI